MMTARIAWTVAALAVCLTVSVVAGEEDDHCTCPLHGHGWEHLPDSATVVPAFLYKPYVELDTLLSTDHGVFFYFVSEHEGETRPTVLAYLLPSRGQMERYVDPEVADRTREVAAETVSETIKWAAFRNSIHRVLGIDDTPDGPMPSPPR